MEPNTNTTIGALCDKGAVRIQTGPFGSQLHAHDYRPDGIAVIPTEAIGKRRIISSTLPCVSSDVAERLARHKLLKSDILFARRGAQATGLSAIITAAHEGALCGTGAILLRTIETDIVDPGFLSFALTSNTAIQWLKDHAVGAVMPNLNADVIRRLEIPLPSIAEQRAIAHILGTLDDKIELNRRTNETLEAMARALFKSWFVDFDPVRAKAEGRAPAGMDAATVALFPSEFQDSEMGPIPLDWEVTTLKQQTSKIGSGATPKGGSFTYIDDGIAFIRSQNVYDSLFVWDGLARISDEAAGKLDGVTVEPNDILLNITGASILRTCIVEPEVLPARVNQHVSIVRAKPDVSAHFLHFVLLSNKTKEYLLGMDAGASRQAVTKAHIESVRFVLPSQPALTRFGELTDPLFDKINNNNAQKRRLTQLRDALLPRLMSGEVSMKNVDVPSWRP